jgi:hypothetical protein
VTGYYITGLADTLTAEVRETRRSPEYGHPVHQEVAAGTGPCRACLEQFRVGEEERILFTYRPPTGNGNLGAPGPVFIHADRCQQYRASSFPPGLRSLPLVIEGIAKDDRVPESRRATGDEIDAALTDLLDNPEIEYLHVRHGVAGCHIARVHRGALS